MLPYDFDQAGLIHTSYSIPADGLGIRSVRQRLFRGRCLNLNHLDESIAKFNELRPQIEEALNPLQINARSRKSALKYINTFYEIINDPKKRKKEIEDDCLGEGAQLHHMAFSQTSVQQNTAIRQLQGSSYRPGTGNARKSSGPLP